MDSKQETQLARNRASQQARTLGSELASSAAIELASKRVIAVYSEAGGATKTTTAVSLAVCAALAGLRTVLVDLDPRAAATKWLGVAPGEEWRHIGAVLAHPEPTGWIEDLALPSPWPQAPLLRIVPSARAVSNREKAAEDHADIRLALALEGVAADVVVLDLPNRQGGPIIQNALTAATDVLYAAKLDEDGLDGLDGAAAAVRRFRDHRRLLGAPTQLREAGIVVGAVRDTIMTLDSKRALTEIATRYPRLLLRPLVPERVIVREARAAGDYHGFYARGALVHDTYTELLRKVLTP